ncbi:glycoside hydrolase family 5 protein [Gaetbulibacter aestuarii]|uniref:Cellulase family glycosylhydrolase n=1 Tax=Gaetbulibacter aestuarii TaxID=1502358 RepID=A0ABW7MWF7_9FLAO
MKLKPLFTVFFICILFLSCEKGSSDLITSNTNPTQNDTLKGPGATKGSGLLPVDYVAQLGKGFDVTWAEFSKYMDLFNEQVVIDFHEAGFTNVRIRVQDEDLGPDFISMLKGQVDFCLAHNIYPIIAYQGHYIEDTATSDADAKDHLTTWWRKLALEFKDYSENLTFNIMVEISGTYKKNYTAINDFYASALSAIRESNPKRIVIFPPVNLSNPDYLQYLQLPKDKYTMVEWHFYAAGPTKDSTNKKYWNDGSTAQERANITDPINTAVNWMQQTGYVTWVGAWMAGNYNKGNDFDIPAQVAFASFMTRSLDAYNIPWSVNAGNKYYDYANNVWFTETPDAAGIPVRDVILDPDAIGLYDGDNYAGNAFRLSEGNYTLSDLQSIGINQDNIKSIMVPFDFKVELYTEDNFGGTKMTYTTTSKGLTGTIGSIKVVNLHSYN